MYCFENDLLTISLIQPDAIVEKTDHSITLKVFKEITHHQIDNINIVLSYDNSTQNLDVTYSKALNRLRNTIIIPLIASLTITVKERIEEEGQFLFEIYTEALSALDRIVDEDLLNCDKTSNNALKGRFSFTIGNPITVKSSTFLGFVCNIHNEEDAHEAMEQILMEFPKTGQATHNMQAWVYEHNGSIEGGHDQDGEAGAGQSMYFLLEKMGVKNIFVCVSRWFGGTLLGPSRFKIINDCAKEVILSQNASQKQ